MISKSSPRSVGHLVDRDRAHGALSHERVRQIVERKLQDERKGVKIDLPTLQLARLEAALRVAARGVEEGDVKAIAPLLKAPAQLLMYDAAAAMRASGSEDIRKRLMEKLNRVAARRKSFAETDALEARMRQSPGQEAVEEEETEFEEVEA